MAKITITAVSIENFGPFRERQVINLSVKSGKPVVLIKALNGSGKTTILTALQVGLYGHKALVGIKRPEYENLILGLMRSDAVAGPVIDIDVTVEISGARRHLSIRREWSVQGGSLQEQVSVAEHGSIDIDFSMGWDDFIGAILPAELVQLFLFDGEKIEALANPERLPELLRRATEVFLGIGGIEALSNDLKALERRAMLKNKGNSDSYEVARTNLLNWEAQEAELVRRIDLLTQEQASVRNTVEKAEAALGKYTAEAQRKGLAAYQQAAEIRNAVVAAKVSVDEAKAELADAFSDPILPIAWLSSIWTQYKYAWEQDQRARHSELLSQEFEKRDGRILAALETMLPAGSIASLRQVLGADLQSFVGTRESGMPKMYDADPRDIEKDLKQARARLKKNLEQLQAAQINLDQSEQRIGQIPAEEQISDILNGLQERSKTASIASVQLSGLIKQLEEAQSNLAHVRIRLNAAQDRIGNEFRDRSMAAKSLEASARARKALVLFKERLLASKAQWLSEMITTEFRKLLHKRNLMTRVCVDPDTYRVSILDGKRQELSMDRLSAGERQLLATAVLSALIKERKGRFPVVVDTPLARLDQQHRSAMIKGFFATVSHQVVVLSTDQEVEGGGHKALRPFTSQEYELCFNDEIGCTTVRSTESEDLI